MKAAAAGPTMFLWALLLCVIVPPPSVAKPQMTAADHLRRGVELGQKGDLEGAIAEFREALRLKPDFADAHLNLGVALRDKGDLDGAIAEHRTALRLQPEDAGAHYALGLALTAKGDRREAAHAFREFLRLAPNTPNNRQFIQKARALLRDLEE